jgi:hypothetical protein
MSWTSITTGTGWSTGAGSLGGGVFSDAGDDWSGALLVPVGELTAAVNTGGLRANHPLDFDLSPGNTVGGSPALDYNSDTVSVRPIIESTLTTDASLGVPTQINTAGGWCRLAAPNPVKK